MRSTRHGCLLVMAVTVAARRDSSPPRAATSVSTEPSERMLRRRMTPALTCAYTIGRKDSHLRPLDPQRHVSVIMRNARCHPVRMSRSRGALSTNWGVDVAAASPKCFLGSELVHLRLLGA